MALVTLEEFQASREAQSAGLSSVDVQDSLDDHEAILYELIGYRVDVPSRAQTFTDAVTTNGDATLTSASAEFTVDDVGHAISGTGIPSGTYIASINSATSIEMSEEATASGTGVSVTVSDVITSTVYGAGRQDLPLTDRIRSLSSLSEWGAGLLATDYELIADGFALRRRGIDRDYWTFDAPVVATGLYGFASGERRRELAERCLRLMVAKDMGSGTNKALQGPAGAYVTGYRTETAEISYYTPQEDPKIVQLLELLRHPLKPKDPLLSVPATGLSPRRDLIPRAN